MTAQQLGETQLVDGLSARQLLEALSRIYRWLLVTDTDRRILWMSDGLSSLFGVDDLADRTDCSRAAAMSSDNTACAAPLSRIA